MPIAALRDAHEAILERARAGVDEQLIDDAQNVDRDFHEALIDHLGNDIISNSYRVNWIKVRLIRQNETALHDALVEPVMQEHLARHRSDRAPRPGRRRRGADARISTMPAAARCAIAPDEAAKHSTGGDHEHHTTQVRRRNRRASRPPPSSRAPARAPGP